MKKILPIFLFLVACNSKQEKIIIFSKGDITVNGNNISVEDGNNYAEKEIVFSGNEKTTLNVKAPSGNFSIDVPGAGYYVLSIRKDTIVGSYQRVGKDLNNNNEMTFEELGVKIDSLQKLIVDSNVSEQNKNFFIESNQLKKITDNTEAYIIGPFQLIPYSFDVKNGKVPEIYKFYTIGEMREMIAKLKKLGK